MGRKIRGLSTKEYAEIMHKIERGQTTEAAEVRKGKLAPRKRNDDRAINKFRDNQVFKKRSKVRGRRSHEDECLVPHCTNDSSRRGLCNTHRTYAYLLIRKNKASEADLIKRNLMLHKASGGDMKSPLARKRAAQEKRMKAERKKKRQVRKKKKSNRPKKSTKKKTSSKRRTTKTKRKSAEKIPERLITSDKCLYPGCKTTRKGGGRGLCSKHYSQYKRKRKKLTERKRKMLDRDLISRHLLLPPKARLKAQKSEPAESSAFELGSTVRGSIRRW